MCSMLFIASAPAWGKAFLGEGDLKIYSMARRSESVPVCEGLYVPGQSLISLLIYSIF